MDVANMVSTTRVINLMQLHFLKLAALFNKYPTAAFLIVGAVLFGLNSISSSGRQLEEIVIRPGDIALEREQSDLLLNQDATEFEQRELFVSRLVRDEVLFREAVKMKMHLTDEVVRRRLISIMEYLIEDTSIAELPTEAELKAYWEAHKSELHKHNRIGFRHVFFSGRQSGDKESHAAKLEKLNAGGDHSTSGEPFIHGQIFPSVSKVELTQKFGPNFASSLFEMVENTWQGPIGSIYGLHLVKIDNRAPLAELPFDAVKGEMAALWREEWIRKVREENFQNLLRKYEVIDPEGSTATDVD